MKNTSLVLLLSFLFLFVHNVNAQSKFELSGGVGFLDFANAGAKYSINTNTNIGVNIGFLDAIEGFELKLLSVEPCVYSHFGVKTSKSGQKLWYAKNGLTWFQPYPHEKYLYYSPRIGRKMYITESFGLSIDAGLYIQLWTSFNGTLITSPPVLPGLGISFFYRL